MSPWLKETTRLTSLQPISNQPNRCSKERFMGKMVRKVDWQYPAREFD
jgi:hypothetical protein